MKYTIFFRADGNVKAGYGHVIRSLSLAAILKKRYNCVFVIQNPDSFLKIQIENICNQIIEIPVSENFLKESKMLSKRVQSDDIVVLDGYNFNTDYQSQIKKKCFKLVCIDDIFENHFVADAIINHGEGIKKSNYSAEKYSQLFLGSSYSILRKSFLRDHDFREIFAEQNRRNAYRIFINLGGTDQQNYTEKALKLCLKSHKVKTIDIVIGSFYLHGDRLAKIQKENSDVRIKIYSNISEQMICNLMKKSSFGICSASTVSYEYVSSGGVLLLYQTVDNQKNIYDFMIKYGLGYPARSFMKILSKVNLQKNRNDYFLNRKKYFPGNSDKNLMKIFDNFELERVSV